MRPQAMMTKTSMDTSSSNRYHACLPNGHTVVPRQPIGQQSYINEVMVTLLLLCFCQLRLSPSLLSPFPLLSFVEPKPMSNLLSFFTHSLHRTHCQVLSLALSLCDNRERNEDREMKNGGGGRGQRRRDKDIRDESTKVDDDSSVEKDVFH